jgi:hypothetical protein
VFHSTWFGPWEITLVLASPVLSFVPSTFYIALHSGCGRIFEEIGWTGFAFPSCTEDDRPLFQLSF